MLDYSKIYSESQIKTATPAKLVEMLYEGGVRFLKEARKALEDKDYVTANEKLKRVQDIVMELNVSLDMEKGGVIAQNLRSLYNYMFQRLLDANIKKNVEIVDEILGYMETLLEVWREAMKKAGPSVTTQTPQQSGLDLSV